VRDILAYQLVGEATCREKLLGNITREENGCWLWKGPFRSNGYGRFKIGRTIDKQAHRVSWVVHFGPIPDGICVLHRCDARDCINPFHLFLGTKQDNTDDMHQKGRWSPGRHDGSCNGRACLTEQQVLEIREKKASGIATRFLVAEYGVTRSTIQKIVRRSLWKEV
jgi:hypothetical protein